MIISKDNYEAFFLDYHEGNLSDALKKEVLTFVNLNPDLKEEFESFEIISLSETQSSFPGKDKLKKNNITEYNYKTWFIAYEENDLDEDERDELEKFLEANPGVKPELEILRQTKMHPDHTIRFKNKSVLKKGGGIIPMWVRVAAAACIVIGLLGFWMGRQKTQTEFVHTNQTESPISPAQNKISNEELNNVAESGLKPVIENNAQKKSSVQPKHKLIENKIEKNLANLDSSPEIKPVNKSIDQPLTYRQEPSDSELQVHDIKPQTSRGESASTIVINENNDLNKVNDHKLIVLDDNDLAELGLKSKEQENKSLFSDAVNGVGKLFGVNAHYEKEKSLYQQKYKETLALGPVAITRTVR